MNIPWSHEFSDDWFPLDIDHAKRVPEKIGVYEIKTDFVLDRLRGKSPIVSIGRAVPRGLQSRLMGRCTDPAHCLNRPEKWLVRANHKLSFRFAISESREVAKYWEALLHWEYENEHWELPPGNDRLEQKAIMEKLEQKIGSTDEQNLDIKLRNLLSEYQTVSRLADYLEVPPVVIDNLFCYRLL